MLQSPPPPETPTPTPAPRRSTRTRKPSTRLVGAIATASLPAPLRLRHINAEPPEQWPPRAEDLPPALRHHLPLPSTRGVKTTNTKKSSKQGNRKAPAQTHARTPSSGSGAGSDGTEKPSSPDPPIVADWSHRTVDASTPYYHPASAVRDSLAREDEIRAAWERNKPVREAQQRQWDMEDRVQKRKLGFMLEHFRAREKEEEEEEGEGERADSGHEEEEEVEEEGREAKKARRD